MPDYSEDLAYGRDRLAGTICNVNGVPRHIRTLDIHNGVPSVSYENIGGGGLGRNWAPLEALDTTPIELGFINSDEIMYAVRLPRRQYRQGLRGDSLRDVFNHRHNNVNFNTRGFIDTVMGIYPTLVDCIERIECGEAPVVAFDRHYAVGGRLLGGMYQLYHKVEKVGGIKLSDHGVPRFDLDDKYFYLQEELQEVVGNAR